MADAVVEHFDYRAASYEAERRRVLPGYDAFYDAAVAALSLSGRQIRRVLDLGAGTGLLAAHIAKAHPGAQLTLLDGAAGMLDRARETFGDGATYVLADLADPLPTPGPWDAVVSGLAIHHLDDAAKRELFACVHAALAPGGMFVNAEQVAGPTALFDDAYHRWHEHQARELGTSDVGWEHAVESMRHDRTASVERQLGWLREAGFADADCLWKDHRGLPCSPRAAPDDVDLAPAHWLRRRHPITSTARPQRPTPRGGASDCVCAEASAHGAFTSRLVSTLNVRDEVCAERGHRGSRMSR